MPRIAVRDVMQENPVWITRETTAAAARDLMYERRIRHLPVVGEDGTLVGLVSHRDLLREAHIESCERPVWVEDERLSRLLVGQIMTRGVETVAPDADAAEAGERMLHEKIGCLPVLAGGRLIGILTEADFVRFVVRLAAA